MNFAFRNILNCGINQYENSLENSDLIKNLDLEILIEETEFNKQKSSIIDNYEIELEIIKNIDKNNEDVIKNKINE